MKALKSLNPYFWKHRNMLSLGVLFIFLSNFFNIFWIQYLGDTIDAIQQVLSSKNNDSNTIIKTLLINGGIIIGSSIIAGVFRFMMRQTIIVTSRKIEYELKNEIYQHYQSLSLTNFKKTSIGDLMNRLSEDIIAIRMYLGPGVMYVANLIILLMITSFYMIRTDLEMTLVILILLPIFSLSVYKVSGIVGKKSKLVQESQSAISTFVQDSFSGIRVVKFFNKEKYVQDKYDEKIKSYQNRSVDLAKYENFFYTSMILIVGILDIAILFIGGQKYINGEINIGMIANFFMYANAMVIPFSTVGWVTSINQRAEASMQRMNEFMNIHSDIVNTNHDIYEIKGDIEFRNVSYTYPNTGIKAVENLSFKVNAGEFITITGKTGSGKSTIALLLCRLIDPDEGEILIDGKNLKEHNLELYRKFIGYIPQESYLFSDTIENNIGFAVDHPTPELIEKFAKIADIHNDVMLFRDKYQTVVGERGVMLSGGQKQRICIARALIKQPQIVIFDDCLSALDTKTEQNILTNIEKEVANCTAIIITHRETVTSSQKNKPITKYMIFDSFLIFSIRVLKNYLKFVEHY